MSEQQTAYNNLYNSLMVIYNKDPPTLTEERRDEIPVIMAFITVHMNDTDKVSEVADKFSIKFDRIYGNPPYIKYQDIPIKQREKYHKWEIVKSGNFNLLFLFFESCHNFTRELYKK